MATTTRTPSRYDGMTREELYELAQQRDIADRSSMNRDELQAALETHDLGPNAVDLLLRQHDQIRSLFEKFESMSHRPSKKKEELVGELITILTKHAKVEELVFYPAVGNEVEGQGDEVDESIEEHHGADLLMRELEGLSSDATRYDTKVHVLMENVMHHIEEEESDLFPSVREALSEERLRQIGAGMQEAWEVAPSRPHPSAPQTPPGNVLLGLPTTAWDLTVNLVRLATRTVLRR
jgi:hemerythrin superfamily protein